MKTQFRLGSDLNSYLFQSGSRKGANISPSQNLQQKIKVKSTIWDLVIQKTYGKETRTGIT